MGSPGRLLWRFVSGQPLDGQYRTDSTFLHPGTRSLLLHRPHPSRWSMLPGWRRSAWRLGPTGLALSSAVGWTLWPVPTLVVDGGITVGAVGWGGWQAHRAARGWQHRRRIVQPLYVALSGALGLPSYSGARLDDWLTVPVGYADDDDAVVRVNLPAGWLGTTEQRKALRELITRKLGGEWDAKWFDVGSPAAEFRHAPKPPGNVPFAMLRAEIERGPASAPVLGLGTRREVIRVDLDAESPHVCLSMGTGGGKSSTLRLIIAHLIRHGVERIDIIDPKRISLNAFKGIPGVFIHRDIEEQITAVQEFRREMEARYRALDDNEDFEFPRRVLVIEEMNSWSAMVRAHWTSIREKEDPKEPPIIADLAFILFQGRQARMNVVTVLQQANARAMGGSDMRDQFGTKILARFSPQVWNMLVGTYPRPKSSRHPGRGLVVIGDDHRTVQLGFITPDEAREYALEHRPAGWRPEVPTTASVTASQPHSEPADMGEADVKLTLVPAPREAAPEPPVDRYSLSEAASAGFVPMSYDALRKARSADPEFPAGTKALGLQRYTAEELVRWYNNRARTTERVALPVETGIVAVDE